MKVKSTPSLAWDGIWTKKQNITKHSSTKTHKTLKTHQEPRTNKIEKSITNIVCACEDHQGYTMCTSFSKLMVPGMRTDVRVPGSFPGHRLLWLDITFLWLFICRPCKMCSKKIVQRHAMWCRQNFGKIKQCRTIYNVYWDCHLCLTEVGWIGSLACFS